MATWAPDLYGYYADYMGRLYAHDSNLKRTFKNSIFAAATYNFGPRTVCFKHTDWANLPFGWCSITALGSFDHTAGGHLVLWQCGLVIEFPAGSTILIPSAVIAHSNTTVAANETRYSFTQYSAGGLFRWVENGFRTSEVNQASLSAEQKVEEARKNAMRWEIGISLLPTCK
ncbi:hypothetical protein CPC08DRAFT_738039 [Agrocybe pediades]|nr:hypothetical protein CPC08DRAFT_738039 [Agrocybe pediades]